MFVPDFPQTEASTAATHRVRHRRQRVDCKCQSCVTPLAQAVGVMLANWIGSSLSSGPRNNVIALAVYGLVVFAALSSGFVLLLMLSFP